MKYPSATRTLRDLRLHPAFLAASLCLLLVNSASFAETAKTSETKPTEKAQGLLPLDDLRTFTKVYDHIHQGYVEEIGDRKLLDYAI